MNEYSLLQKYISYGWVIHPLSKPDDKGNSPGKRPLIPGWQKLTHDHEDIVKYIKDGCNIGLVCGKASGVVVLDFDHELFKDDVFHGIELNTLISGRTNGRGHIYFKYNPMLMSQKRHDLGIEILSDGNNAVLPPSVHNSGQVYKWTNPDAPIMEMPEEVMRRLNALFHTETELKQILSKCRHCFRDVIKRKPDMRGAEGREYMLAICTDIKAVKDRVGNSAANSEHIRMFAKLMYGNEYNDTRTLQEWSNIDASKTWKCDTLKSKLPAYIDPATCNKCDKRNAAAPKKEYKTNGAFDYIDRITEKTPIYYDNSGQFWLWSEDGYYKQVDNTEILLTLLKDIADPAIIQQKFKAELLEAARLRGRDARVSAVPNHWIHLQNGVYDIKTGELSEPTPEYLFTDPIPHKISDSEDTPTIDKLFSEWVTPEKIPLLNELAGYCLYNGYPIHRMFLLVGRGRNGKGQYRDLLVHLIGEKNRSSSSLEQLINSRFESARLFNKKLCTMGEINYTLLDRTAILKMLCGGDPIPAEMKNKIPFEFVNTAKLIINTNSLPMTADKTDAFYSRCVTLEFINQFEVGKDIIKTIPESEYDNFLTKSLRILGELLDRGNFTNEGSIREKQQQYEAFSNPLNEFITMSFIKDVNGITPLWHIVEQFKYYLVGRGLRQLTDTDIRKQIETLGYEIETNHRFDGFIKNGQWSGVVGLEMINSPYKYKSVGDKNDTNIVSAPTKTQRPLMVNVGDVGDVGDVSLGTLIRETSGSSPTSPTSPTEIKPATQFKDFGLRAKDWICYHSKSITRETVIEASMWVAESLKDVKPSDVKAYLEREYKLTPDIGKTQNESTI